MKVRITVSTSGKAQNVGKSNSLILADVATMEEIIEAMSKEFKDMFPVYQTLDKPQGKRAKAE